MDYHKTQPSRYEQAIQCVWQLKTRAEDNQSGIYCIPDNYCELMLNLGPDVQFQAIATGRTRIIKTGDLVIFNCKSRGLYIQEKTDVHLISLKLNPGYVDGIVPGIEWSRRDQCIVLQNIDNLEDPEAQLMEYMDINFTEAIPDQVVVDTMACIRESHGELKLKDLYEPLGVSKSTLEHKFNKTLNISPKEYCKIEKMNRFLRNFSQYQSIYNLTQLTLMSGYYDQSHFIKDFKYFLDMTPRKFLKAYSKQVESMIPAA